MYRTLVILAVSSIVISNVLASRMKSYNIISEDPNEVELNYPCCEGASDDFFRSDGKRTFPTCPCFPWAYNNIFYRWLTWMGIMTPPVSESFATKLITPDVVDTAPTEFIGLSYPSGVTACLGNELTPRQVKDQPAVSFKADPKAWYTLILTDPDNYEGPECVYREWRHWIVVNIPGKDADVNKGETLAGYIGSGPPEGTGIHRYVYLLFKQPSKLQFDEPRLDNKSVNGRAAFSTKKFSEKHNLGAPVAGNFYLAQFDDYVPLLYKSLGA